MDHCKPVVDGLVRLPEYGCAVQTSCGCGCGCTSLGSKNWTKLDFKTLLRMHVRVIVHVFLGFISFVFYAPGTCVGMFCGFVLFFSTPGTCVDMFLRFVFILFCFYLCTYYIDIYI